MNENKGSKIQIELKFVDIILLYYNGFYKIIWWIVFLIWWIVHVDDTNFYN